MTNWIIRILAGLRGILWRTTGMSIIEIFANNFDTEVDMTIHPHTFASWLQNGEFITLFVSTPREHPDRRSHEIGKILATTLFVSTTRVP